MEESEAIRELHKIRPRGGIIPQKRAEALDVAIQALEKQIPKKPIENDTNSFDCPCCKYDLKTDTGNPFGDYFLSYCDNCGQKIDWSDEE